MKVLPFLIIYGFQSHPYQAPSPEKLKPNHMASLSGVSVSYSDQIAFQAFFCIVDNSEAFSYTVIKDEFSSPVEKTPQFSFMTGYIL